MQLEICVKFIQSTLHSYYNSVEATISVFSGCWKKKPFFLWNFSKYKIPWVVHKNNNVYYLRDASSLLIQPVISSSVWLVVHKRYIFLQISGPTLGNNLRSRPHTSYCRWNESWTTWLDRYNSLEGYGTSWVYETETSFTESLIIYQQSLLLEHNTENTD